ncbi:MAG: hypothetical protein FJ405_17250, partial [Verrucomicrobia bacterium]|nr:hypothetical protein [Verrucomicrobiota bacterium]
MFITNISADEDTGKLVVQVNHGTPAGNDAPIGSIKFWTPSGAVGQKVYFTADVSDADGDEIAYHWQIAGAGVLENSPTVGTTFTTTGTKIIKCIVSDMHGGVRTLTANFSILLNKPPTISAISDKIMNEDTVLSNIPFVVDDPTSDPSTLQVTASSDNTSLFPSGSLILSSAGGGNRRITLDPAQNKHGTATITLRVTDGLLASVEQFKVTVQPITPGVAVFNTGASWRYWDADSAPTGDWKSPGYSALSWKLDNTRFVYGQGTPAPTWTTLATPTKIRTTCYFRRSFSIPANPTGALTLRLLCDDGAVVYIDGVEVWRQNMPDGTPTHTTRAESSVGGIDELEWTIVPLEYSQVNVGGTSVIAVEVHDAGNSIRGSIGLGGFSSGDVTFDCELAMADAPDVGRLANVSSPEDTVAGPYSFSASDSESPGGPLTITGFSSNSQVVRDEDIKFGFNILTRLRTVSITPRPNATGVTVITVKVSDGSSETHRSFRLTVTPVNDAPTIQPLPLMTVALGELVPLIEVQVNDVDDTPGSLVVTAGSANGALLDASGIQVLPGTTPNKRWLRFTPKPLATGQSLILVRVSDGSLTDSILFTFRVSTPLSIGSSDIRLVSSGDLWRYWVQRLPIEPRTGDPVDFTDPKLDDRAWPSGRTQLGYGDGDEVTVIPSTPLRVTTYFRTSFIVPNPALISSLKLRLLRDDGAAVYLNGVLIAASNLPRTFDADTTAVLDIFGAGEDAWISSVESASNLRAGRNVIAVEVHQSALPTALARGDLSFDLELDAVPAPAANGVDVLIAPGDVWRYWDRAEYPDDSWRTSAFVDQDWKLGFARLGYGVGGESTVVNDDNASATGRNPSVLFRKVFDVANPSVYQGLHLFVLRDDGIAVHLNGTRILSDNLLSTSTLGTLA